MIRCAGGVARLETVQDARADRFARDAVVELQDVVDALFRIVRGVGAPVGGRQYRPGLLQRAERSGVGASDPGQCGPV